LAAYATLRGKGEKALLMIKEEELLPWSEIMKKFIKCILNSNEDISPASLFP
jgi:hypothetical protein